MLGYGVARQIFNLDTDAAKYQCYALAFWNGTEALHHLPPLQCSFINHPVQGPTPMMRTTIVREMQRLGLPSALVEAVAAQSSSQPYHALPHEYPLLAVFVFLPALAAPAAWYQVAFALWMALVAVAIYLLLLRNAGRGAALAFVLYLALGSWVTALTRFDLVPAALTFIALLCAERARWRWAFVLLALATMLKFYPLVLVLPFFIAQQKEDQHRWFSWRRWLPLAAFVAVCALLMLMSLCLSVEGTLGPLSYFGDRPIQIESSLASALRLVSAVVNSPLHYAYSFGSRNVSGTLSPIVTRVGTGVEVAALLMVYGLQWRGTIRLSLAVLVTLLVVIVTGKVFSAQYLIWLLPLVAYVGGWRWPWLLGWGSISLLTTLIYPFIYDRGKYPFGYYLPELHTTIVVRNVLLLVFTCALVYWGMRSHRRGEVR